MPQPFLNILSFVKKSIYKYYKGLLANFNKFF